MASDADGVSENEAVRVKTLSVKELGVLINQLHGERFRALHEKITGPGQRAAHYFNDESANPVLPKPYTGKSTYQTQRVRKAGVDLKARLTENQPIPRVHPPQSTPKSQKRADALEMVLASGFQDVQGRQQADILGALVDGQLYQCYGVFHWRKYLELWPSMSEKEELKSEPLDGEAKRYKRDGAKYIETDDSFQTREKRRKALAGFPWYLAAIHPATFSFDPDPGVPNGMRVALTVTEISVMEYCDELKKKGIFLSGDNQQKKGGRTKIRAYTAPERPAEWMPSGPRWAGRKFSVAVVWTADEFYELVREGPVIAEASGESGWEIVQSGTHPYGMPPFALAPADQWNEPDPVRRYEPALAGLLRLKPIIDFLEAMAEVLAVSTAAPIFVLESENVPGTFAVDAEGKQLVLSLDSAMGAQLPPGYRLRDIRGEVSAGFVQFLDTRRQEFQEIMPRMGISEVGASTTPWNMMLQLQESAVPVKRYLANLVHALRIGFRSMASVMALSAEDGGFGEPIYTFAVTENGKIDKTTVVGIEPGEIETLEIDVQINPRSSAERITSEQHGITLLSAGLITEREFDEEFRQIPDPSRAAAERMAERISRPIIEDAVRRRVAAHFGPDRQVGPGGSIIGEGGQEVPPQEAVASAAAAGPLTGVNNGVAGGLQPLPPMRGPGGV